MRTTLSHAERRALVRRLIDEQAPADALAAYYALYAPTERAEVFVQTSTPPPAPADGFLVRARTGIDLFRPLVTYRAKAEAAAAALFEQGLIPGHPVYLTVPTDLANYANKHLRVTDAEIHRLYRLDPAQHQPHINVLVLTGRDPHGGPRCEIRAGDDPGAVAGLNWQSPRFAEIYVYTHSSVRGRGWGKSVVGTLAGLVLQSGRLPLYVVAESNDYSIRLAESVGFVDTGAREFVCQALRPG